MNEATYVYIVHSDINENNIYAEFATEEEAIDYARRHKDELTYVDKVEAALDEDGEIIEIFDGQTIWVYDEEDSFEFEEEFNEFNIDFEEEPSLSEGITLRTKEEQDEFFRLCDEIGIITGKDLEKFKKEVGCTDKNILQALRDYRAELGPDFKIANPEYERELALSEEIDFDKLVEELEEFEDEVECKKCYGLFPKESCVKSEHGYVCQECNNSSALTEYWFNDDDPMNWSDKDPIIYNVYYQDELVGYLQFDYRGYEEEPREEEIDSAISSLLADIESIPEDYNKADVYFELGDYYEVDESLPILEESLKSLAEDTTGLRLYGVGDTDGNYFGQVRAASDEEAYNKACAIWPEREVRGYGLDKVHLTIWEEDEDALDPDLLAEDVREVKCKEYEVVSHSEDEKPVDCKGEEKPLEKPLTESSLVKGNYEISPTEHLSWGWDKGDTFYVEKNYRASEKEQIWNTEFRRTYATAEDAEKAFKRYVKKYSVLTEDALDWELEKVEIDVDSLEETDVDVKGECTVHGKLETFNNTKERTEDDARFDYDKKEDEAEVKGLSSDFTDSDVDKIERIVARDVRLNLKKNTK